MESSDLSRKRQWLPPSPVLSLAVLYVATFLASILISRMMAGTAFPSPFAPRAGSDAYFVAHPGAVGALAILQICASILLGMFAAIVASELRSLGTKEFLVQMALLGGIAASIFEGAAGCAQWVISQPGVSEIPAVTRPLHLLSFAAGGPVCLATVGLFVASVSGAGLRGVLPRWFTIAGNGTAAAAFLSVLALVEPAATHVAVLARVACFAWMICLGVLLPRARPDR
jgi:hypothetical protein